MAAFVPQVLKSVTTRSTKDLSLPMLVIMAAGLWMWLTYGLATGDPALIFTNIIQGSLATSLVILKLRYG